MAREKIKSNSLLPTIGVAILFVLLAAFLLLPNFFDIKRTPLRVAVAANFSVPMRAIADEFEKAHSRKLDIIMGSTGNLYSQITNGAPFYILFAADVERPQRLEEEGYTSYGSRFTYAIGRIILWSRNDDLVEDFPTLEGILSSNAFRRLAIANSDVAPYGVAAQQVLEGLGLWDLLQSKIVRGENISQTYQFVRSRNAQIGIIALSEVSRPGTEISGSHWEIPDSLYQPIEQQAVVLADSSDLDEANAFIEFVKSDEIRALIRQFGYKLPGD